MSVIGLRKRKQTGLKRRLFSSSGDYSDGWNRIDVPSQTQVVVKGIDKQVVGEMAANIRKVRVPEPYKGKGIKYSDEVIRRKEGKTGK